MLTEPLRPIIYDLHSHSQASDGVLSAQDLVLRACERGVTVLAITDHDTTAALATAQAAIDTHNLDLTLVSGVEISTLWENHEIHIVGLGFDPHHPAMKELLHQQFQRREDRAVMIAERLAKAGIADTLAGAREEAGDGQITRAHFARYLIRLGKADTMAQVFKNYLARGKTGYVPAQWCSIPAAIEAIHLAGGAAVVAHPARYQLSTKWLKRLLAYFAEVGGDAMEVAQCQQAPNERQQLARYALDYGLSASQGSDFHQPCAWIELGRKLWLPKDVVPVWEKFPALAAPDRG
ncbi:RNase RNM [Rosenbergiella collisarenosi]|uniref:RNase RNM n=1 Tax=Rosenbergiella collisarenosi TaxID=1544695 RepID=UPI001BDA1FAE|nr:PHP domain-containing protein [Rosenbergiella collisarenosi]MBT0722415.1 PHP domain-containing protein [Rosenbergiella collisarenosi]